MSSSAGDGLRRVQSYYHLRQLESEYIQAIARMSVATISDGDPRLLQAEQILKYCSVTGKLKAKLDVCKTGIYVNISNGLTNSLTTFAPQKFPS